MTQTPEQWASVQSQIRDLANTTYPLEACGFVFTNAVEHLVGDPRPTVVKVDNVAEWPYAQYMIKDEDTAWALRTGRCIGIWHSHPSDPAVPSEMDQELASQEGIFYIIYAVQDEDMATFLVQDGRLVLQQMVMPS